jgi:acetoacetyl-CoA reductase
MSKDGLCAIVTGSASGLGAATAGLLAEDGARIVVNYSHSKAEAEATADLCRKRGAEVVVVQGDVSRDEDCRKIVAAAAPWGRLDVLVNNAGITRDATMHRMSFEQWNAVIQTNLASCFNMSSAVIEGMRSRGFGRVVNIGSINGQAGQYGQVNYAAAKSGIHGFTKALAQEGASRGITVNAVAPGYVDTEMVRAVPAEVLEKIIARIPVGRLGKAEDIARTVLFLVADEAGFITGSTLSVNGGQHMY